MIKPDNYYYKKLTRLMKYVQGTIGFTLILSIDKSDNIKLYIDAAFAGNRYMRIHTGGFMTMGTGRVYVKYRKI